MDAARKSLDEELARARVEVEELQRALSQAQREIQRSSDAERRAHEELHEFVYAASHDLQQPLRAVRAYAQLLQRDYAHDAQASELTAFIIDGANQMGHFIRDLSTYSRSGALPRRTTFKLDVPLQEAVLKLTEKIRETGAKITASDLPEITADEGQVAQMLFCIIENALKYVRAESAEIEISAEEGPDEVTVSVKDNGPGIEARFHEQVFLPFKRLHGKEIPGSGLGLATCRKIVHAHGGIIWVESDGAHGSVVKFTLPF